MKDPVFSVVTPTYNRADLLSRVYLSLKKQSFKSFEWIVIDDGSTDNTLDVISEFKKDANFTIKYIKTKNSGKVSALNTSIEYCEGFFYLVFDSDDWCDSNALEVFYKEYLELKKEVNYDSYCALSALKRYQSGSIVGDDYARVNKYGLTYIDRINNNIQGDKWECLIFNKMHHLLYPVAESEKYMAPSYIWLQLAKDNLKTVFINKALSTIEYQSDGISKNNLKNRLNSIKSTIKYYQFSYQLKNLSYTKSGRYYANYIRFCMHNESMGKMSLLYSPFYAIGVGLYIKDKKNHSAV